MHMIKNLFWNSQERRIRALWRMLVQFVLMFVGMVGFSFVIGILYVLGQALLAGPPDAETFPYVMEDMSRSLIMYMLNGLLTLVATLLSMGIAGRFLDHRPFKDFGFHLNGSWLLDMGFGLVLGIFLMAGVFLIEWAAGWITPSWNVQMDLTFVLSVLAQLVFYLCVGIYEEAMSRGYQLQNLAEGLNFARWGNHGALLIAWITTSVIFGLGHALNPNTTIISTLTLSLAGIFLGLGYVLTGELAIPIGLHITWNLFQGTVFGFPVSGTNSGPSLVSITQGGPDMWTGGAFGPEAGLMGIGAMVVGSILTLVWVRVRYQHLDLQSSLAEYTPPEPKPQIDKSSTPI